MMALCVWCGTDEFADLDPATGVAVCHGPGHPTERMWEPKEEAKKRASRANPLSDGIAAQLGLYDDLPKCLNPGEWAETGVVEHRYGAEHPREYRWMVDRWGHVAQGPRKYSVTSFIGSTLGALSRATNVTYRQGRGSGFFDYNPTIGLWTLEPVPDDATVMSWASFAESLGHNARDWPLLNYRSGQS